MDIREEVLEMKKEVKDIQEHSFAMELLKDQKKQNKRMFIIILVILGMFTCLLGYTIWLLNDISTEETIITQDNADGYNNYIGNDGDSVEDKVYIYFSEVSKED